MAKMATLHKQLEPAVGTLGQNRAVYRLSPLYERDGELIEFVVVSAVDISEEVRAMMDVMLDTLLGTGVSNCETYIFQSDADGNITDWAEMDGSVKGIKDHATALRGLGYELS